MPKRTTAQLLAEALAFNGRYGSETEGQASNRRLQRNACAATELLRLDALRLELQTQLAGYKEACTKAETRADQAEGRAKLLTCAWIKATDAVPQESDGEVFVRFSDGSIGTGWATYWHGSSNDFARWTFPDPDEFRLVSEWAKNVPASTGMHWTENEPVRLPQARTGRVYLAGPMTGISELNFPAFNQEAERLRAEGLQVLNPADHGIVDGADWADYLRHDISGLASCERIHLLRGWTKSKGACLEMTIAKALGMTVTYQVDAEMEHNNAPAVPQGEQATIAGLDAANGHLSILLDDSVLMLKQLRQMVDDLHERWSNGGKPERGEFELLDRVDDWLSCRPVSMLSTPPATNVPQEPVMWQYRTWYAENTGTPGWSDWEELKPRNPYTDTVADRVAELQYYIASGYKYELRSLCVATPAPAPAQEVASAFTKALDIRLAQGWNLTGNAIPVLYTDTINDYQVRRDDVWLCTTDALKTKQEVGLTASQFDLICKAIDKADTATMEGDYMLGSDDCINVVRVMQALFDVTKPAQEVPSDPNGWCQYVAGMVFCWLQMQTELPPESQGVAAIAGIIERRLWAYKPAQKGGK